MIARIRRVTVLVALAIVAGPTLGLAQGCEREHMTETSSQCQQGQTWDAASQTCVTPVNS